MTEEFNPKRSRTIDIARGLLFTLMASTHTVSLLKVPSSHWLMSLFWLPRGWATAAFVVLSGYGVGYIYSRRYPVAERNRILRRRSGEILLVMLLSNSIFAVLKLALAGDTAPAFTLDWWWGFISLDTEWSISGVLLPTALVLLCGPTVIRWTQAGHWRALAVLLCLRVLVSMLALGLGTSAYAGSWGVRFFLLEGFGGFAVLPFLANGCLGIWLGMLRYRNPTTWVRAVAVLLALQVAVYLTSLVPPLEHGSLLVGSVGALGKFAWVFVCARMLVYNGVLPLAAPLERIGKFALNSFVMHRVFLQSLAMAVTSFGLQSLPIELRYAILWLGTLVLTWTLCSYPQSPDPQTGLHAPLQDPLLPIH